MKCGKKVNYIEAWNTHYDAKNFFTKDYISNDMKLISRRAKERAIVVYADGKEKKTTALRAWAEFLNTVACKR